MWEKKKETQNKWAQYLRYVVTFRAVFTRCRHVCIWPPTCDPALLQLAIAS